MTLLLIQMSAVLLTTLLCGAITRKLGQARVVGEIIGGILLGPSAFGRLAPTASARLFPQSSLASFEVLSTIGLILFLFLIGSELNYEHLRRQRGAALLTSVTSILLPFLMAAAVAPSLRTRFAPDGVGPIAFALFLGISMSITAFPVLARILEERGIQSTPLGVTALLCAAVDDVCAWLLLAAALTLIPHAGNSTPLPLRILWLCIYLAVMLGIVRPLASWLARRRISTGLSYEIFAIVLAVVLASAAATETIGIHPLFGAFLAGICLPRIESWQATVRARLDTIVSVLLLPLFFALTGMRTRLDLFTGRSIWLWTAIILAVAIAGKMGGAIFAARCTGQTWQNALALGALINTRGLVELIVLNIAYNAHVFSPALFTMLVVMALVTTAITTPMLNLLGIADHSQQSATEPSSWPPPAPTPQYPASSSPSSPA
jgi:Kef-type K+ transport system membrane component KefB